jgi:hypothetical protein
MKPSAFLLLLILGFVFANAHPDDLGMLKKQNAELTEKVNQLSLILAKLSQIDTTFFHYTRLVSWPIEQNATIVQTIGDTLARKTNQREWKDNLKEVRVISAPGSKEVIAVVAKATINVGDTITPTYQDQEKYIPRTDLEPWVLEKLANLAPPVSRIHELTPGSWGRESANSELSLNSDDKTVITKLNRYAANGVDHDSVTVLSLRFPDKASLLYHNKWGLEARIGNEEMGYPFWTSGNMSFLAIYNRIKLGVQAPFHGGRNEPKGIGKILKSRRLEGTWGITGECDFIDFGGSFAAGLRRTDTDGAFVNSDSIFVIRRMIQAWYSQTIGYNNKRNLLRLKIGFGFHQIGRDVLLPARTEVVNGTPLQKPIEILGAESDRTYWSPYIKIEYINQSYPELFGFSFQYYQEWALGTAWLEIIPNYFRLEVKGGAPILRKTRPWEPTYFVTLAPSLTLWF